MPLIHDEHNPMNDVAKLHPSLVTRLQRLDALMREIEPADTELDRNLRLQMVGLQGDLALYGRLVKLEYGFRRESA